MPSASNASTGVIHLLIGGWKARAERWKPPRACGADFFLQFDNNPFGPSLPDPGDLRERADIAIRHSAREMRPR